MNATIIYEDGRFPYTAAAAHEPGDVVTRPDGTLAIFDGLEGCAIGDKISPDPINPRPITQYAAASAATWAAAAVLYWDATAKQVTTTSSGNTRVGVSTKAKLAGETSALVNGLEA